MKKKLVVKKQNIDEAGFLVVTVEMFELLVKMVQDILKKMRIVYNNTRLVKAMRNALDPKGITNIQLQQLSKMA